MEEIERQLEEIRAEAQKRVRNDFLRGDPYVLTEPRDLAVLAARLARAFQEGWREGR